MKISTYKNISSYIQPHHKKYLVLPAVIGIFFPIIKTIFLVLSCLGVYNDPRVLADGMGIYYIAPNGSDITGSGTIGSPRFSLNKARSVVQPGETIYLRGGTYYFNTQQYLNGKSGTSGNMIKVFAYPGELPILSKSSSYTQTSNHGIFFHGDYVHFKGLDISGYIQPNADALAYGFRVENSNNNIFEQLNIHDNGLGMVISNLGSTEHSSNNQVLNSDFHHNQDPLTAGDPYGNADGLDVSWITHPEDITIISGCRARYNSDDGYDFFRNEGTVSVTNSIAFLNGYIPDTNTVAGDGNGFKLGPTNTGYASEIKRVLNNTLAFNNRTNGYDVNGGRFRTQLFNNTAYANGNRGFRMADDFYGEALSHIVKNNIAYKNTQANNEFSPNSILSNNIFLINYTLNPNYSLTDADFLSLNYTGIDGIRNSNGSFPEVNFLHLIEGSELIDGGTDVGLPYNGQAPDLGIFESNYQPSDNTPPVITAFTIPTNSFSMTIPIWSFTATDNNAISGYIITENATNPSLGASGWTVNPPSQYTVSSTGNKTLYAWAKDAAGNISSPVSSTITIKILTKTRGVPKSKSEIKNSIITIILRSRLLKK